MVAFYHVGLGLRINVQNEWFVEFQLTTSSHLSVADESRATIKSSNGQGITIGLQVADIEAAHARFVAAGLSPTKIRKIWGSAAFYVFDPEGNRIEFWSGEALT